jgi:hypothetical protein
LNESVEIGNAEIRRYLLRKKSALITVGDFDLMFQELRRHTRRWDVPIDDLSYVMLRQAIGGSVLVAAGRPPDESSAYTFNITEPPINVFCSVNGVRSTVVGRAFLEDVQAEEASRLFVESHRPRGDPTRSVLNVIGLDLLEIFEQYFVQSVQLPTRFFELGGDEMIMIQSLPQSDPSWILELKRTDAPACIEEADEAIESRTFAFACGCTAEKLADALLRMWGHKPDDLFGGQAGIEVSCPRCGTGWFIDRASFDRQWEKHLEAADLDEFDG